MVTYFSLDSVADTARPPAIAAISIYDRRTVVSYPRFNTPRHIRSAVEALNQLESDWDSYGAEPLDTSLIKRAGRALDQIYGEAERVGVALPDPVVAPGADGSIAFVWRSADRKSDVEIVVTAESVDFVAARNGKVADGPVSDSSHVVKLLLARVLDD